MSKVLELQSKLDSLLNEQRAMTQASPGKTPEGWIKSVEARNELMDQIKYQKEIDNLEKITIAVQSESEESRAKNTIETKPSLTYDDVFWRYMSRSSTAPLHESEMQLLEARGTNTQKTSTNSLGGFLVPQSFSNQLENMMLYYGGMMEACGTYEDTIGGTLSWPTGDDTAVTGAITAHGVDVVVSDFTFGQVTFGDYSIDSNIVKVSRELIQDERVNFLQKALLENIGRRLGAKVNTLLTNGTGTSQPYGLTVASTTSGGTTASATAITKAEIIKFSHSVDRSYRYGPNVGFMMHDTILAYLRTLDATTDTTHLFVDTIIGGEPVTTLLGRPIFINNDLEPANSTTGLPVTAKKHIYYGDFSKYIIRKIAPISIERNDQLYWASKTVGFMGWLRMDGNLINNKAIKSLLQA